MRRLDLPVKRGDTSLSAEEPVAGFRATAEIAPRLTQPAVPPPAYNGPGSIERAGTRAHLLAMTAGNTTPFLG